MTITIKATYQNGAIRPLEAVDLEENEQITVQITHRHGYEELERGEA